MKKAVLKEVPIGDVVLKASTWNPARDAADDEISYIDLSAIDNVTKVVNGFQSLAGRDAPSRARQLVQAGDILVSTVRPNLNGVARVPNELNGATASTGFCVLRPHSGKVDSSFLFHWVQSSSFVEDMVRKATGASYPAVSDKIIFQSAIPLPSLDEQKRIAAILDQADDLRRKRQRAIDRLNQLGQAIFYDMFGDVVVNSKGWQDDLRLGEVTDIVSGITKGRKPGSAQLRPVPYMAVSNVQDHHLKLEAVKSIEASEAEIARYKLKKGDLLLTEGGDPDKLGRGALWNDEIEECIHQNHIFRVRITSAKIQPDFLCWLVGSERGKRYFFKSSKQTTGIASINKKQLGEFPLLLPALKLQTEFSDRLAKLAVQMELAEQSAAHIGALFASLQHRAFRGDLGEAVCD